MDTYLYPELNTWKPLLNSDSVKLAALVVNTPLLQRARVINIAFQALCSGNLSYSWNGAWGTGGIVGVQYDSMFCFITDYYYSRLFLLEIRVSGTHAGEYRALARW